MRTAVSRWGHSLAVRIPSKLARSHGITEGMELEIADAAEEGLQLRPVGPTLAELVGGITAENRHAEVSTGSPVGREIL